MRRAMLVAVVLSAAACNSFRPTGRAVPVVDEVVRIESVNQPLTLAVRATEESATFQYCQARLVQGYVSAVIADTVIFRELTRIDPAEAFGARCRSSGAARLVLRTGAMISEERPDRGRTIGVVLMGALIGAMVFSGM